ncbi:MAG: hypothetical protein ACKESC_00800 [Candidatus Hodgkinia cicadicola]
MLESARNHQILWDWLVDINELRQWLLFKPQMVSENPVSQTIIVSSKSKQ